MLVTAQTATRAAGGHAHSLTASPFRQPRAVWAVAFACVVSFMGIGLVDPILPALGSQLRASPSHLMRSVGDHADIGRLVAVHANEAGARLVTIGGPTQR